MSENLSTTFSVASYSVSCPLVPSLPLQDLHISFSISISQSHALSLPLSISFIRLFYWVKCLLSPRCDSKMSWMSNLNTNARNKQNLRNGSLFVQCGSKENQAERIERLDLRVMRCGLRRDY